MRLKRPEKYKAGEYVLVAESRANEWKVECSWNILVYAERLVLSCRRPPR